MTINNINKQKGDTSIFFDGVKLGEVTDYKYLGLNINNKLTWNNHIQKISEKISPILGAIKRCAHMLNIKSKYLLYNSFIEPHIRYLIVCWGNAPRYILDKLQRVQNKAIKQIFSFEYMTPSETLYKQTNILNIEQLKMYEQIKFVKCIEKGLTKNNLKSKLIQTKDCHQHTTRNGDLFRNALVRTKKCQNSPLYASIQAYNQLLDSIKKHTQL